MHSSNLVNGLGKEPWLEVVLRFKLPNFFLFYNLKLYDNVHYDFFKIKNVDFSLNMRSRKFTID